MPENLTPQEQHIQDRLDSAVDAANESLDFARSTGVPRVTSDDIPAVADDIEQHGIAFVDPNFTKNQLGMNRAYLGTNFDGDTLESEVVGDQRQGQYNSARIFIGKDDPHGISGVATVSRTSAEGDAYSHTFKSPEATVLITKLAAKMAGKLAAERAISVGQAYLRKHSS